MDLSDQKNENIVTCNIFGGQGNQMFQIAMTLIIAQMRKCSAKFRKNKYATVGKLRNINWSTLFQKCDVLDKELEYIRITDDDLDEFIENVELLSDRNIFLDGYLAKSMYLIPYKKYLRNFFFDYFDNSNIIHEILKKYSPVNKVAIHIRSFESSPAPGEKNINFYSTVHWCYYKSVLNRYDELKNKEILMFIDDVSDVNKLKSYFPAFTIVEEDEDVSLYIMSKCEYLIRSNSTFSWWATFLSDTLKKTYVPSEEWVIESNKLNSNHLLDNCVVHNI